MMNDNGGLPEDEIEPSKPSRETIAKLQDWTNTFSPLVDLVQKSDDEIALWLQGDMAKEHLHVILPKDYVVQEVGLDRFAQLPTPDRNFIMQLESLFEPVYELILAQRFDKEIFRSTWNQILDLAYGEGNMEGKKL